MSKTRYVQLNTKKYENDCRVAGSNLYIIPFTRGTSRDLRKEYADYIIAKATGSEMPTSRNKNIIDTYWGVFYKPEDMEYDEFCRKIEDGKIAMIGHTPIIPTGNDYTRTDNNGNLLVKTLTSKLEDYNNCGNMLIDGRTGEILRMPQPSTIINSLTDDSNYYTIEIYGTTVDKQTDNKIVTDKSYNFLDADGKIVNADTNFRLSEDGYSICQFPRNYYDRDGKKVINDDLIYPEGYVVVEGRFINFYESPIALIEENRYRTSNGLAELVDDERIYLEALYHRKDMLDKLVTTYGIKYDEGKITDKMYSKLMDLINDEYDKYEEFESKYETESDRKFAESLENIHEQN